MKINTELHGERISIRNYRREDQAFCASMWLDEENGRYMSDPNAAYVDEKFQRALDELQDSDAGYYMVVEDGGVPVGTCCAFPEKDGRTYDIGYCVHISRWHQGYGTEIVQTLVEWIKQQGGKYVTAEVAVKNDGSNALLRKCGFTVAGEAEFKKYGMDVRYKSYLYRLEIV